MSSGRRAGILDRMQSVTPPPKSTAARTGAAGWALGIAGLVGLTVSFVAARPDATAASSQDWSPFVLVTGLLLVGLVANEDGLFAASGNRLARLSSNGFVLFLGAAALIGAVTAILNLDTSVAFLTPVLVYTARSRGGGEAPLLYGCSALVQCRFALPPWIESDEPDRPRSRAYERGHVHRRTCGRRRSSPSW